MAEGERTGASSETYDLFSVVYHALQGADTYEQYIRDAEGRGDDPVAQFFRDVQERDRQTAERGQELLRERL